MNSITELSKKEISEISGGWGYELSLLAIGVFTGISLASMFWRFLYHKNNTETDTQTDTFLMFPNSKITETRMKLMQKTSK